MPINTSYPGVYILEQSSGVQTISGVATSVAAMFGTAGQGRIGEPTRVVSFDGFATTFGDDPSKGEMSLQARQFFGNGGGIAWVTRLASQYASAEARLLAEDGGDALAVTAADAGVRGDQLQVEIDYDTPSPERTFNLTVYRRTLDANNKEVIEGRESFANLSMNPDESNFVETRINGVSAQVKVESLASAPAQLAARSLSGLYFNDAPPQEMVDTVNAAIDAARGPGSFGAFMISVAGQPAVPAKFEKISGGNFSDVSDAIKAAIDQALQDNGQSGNVTVDIVQQSDTASRLLRFSTSDGPLVITSATSRDVAATLHLGAQNGGAEWDEYSTRRPAPTGIVARPQPQSMDAYLDDVHAAAAETKSALVPWELTVGANTYTDNSFTFANPSDPLHASPNVTHPAGFKIKGSLRALIDNLRVITRSIDGNSDKAWTAGLHGVRLAIRAKATAPELGLGASLATPNATAFASLFDGSRNPANVNAYKLGSSSGPFVSAATKGDDGKVPEPQDYDAAYRRLAQEADIFNILMLPRCETPDGRQSDDDRRDLWGPASSFCRDQRAFLIVDPPSDSGAWSDVNEVTDPTELAKVRVGLVTDHAAIYWPRVKVTGPTGREFYVDPCGTLAGLYARTDENRGVWKAPAGIGARMIGVRGLEHRVTDVENGFNNLAAINTNRLFPQGVVSWGARTIAGFENSGETDWRYIPVRRLALFIEESLYRGLKFAVFEPNYEPLWTQIRIAAGSFMNNLFRQGAFKGTKKDDAYFVLCDATTTTPHDMRLGIVNVRVGFAALYPAEFVVVTIRQMAGQSEA